MICFLGTSHAARHLSQAAKAKGLELCALHDAELVFISEDTPTNADGTRDLDHIREYIEHAQVYDAPIVLTSQVPPGFTRAAGIPWHQSETLRIKDASERALNPEMFIVGGEGKLPPAYQKYLEAFNCPVLRMSLEDAEFAKMAINRFLISQVETTNELKRASEKVGVRWALIKEVLQHDSRIGPHAYLDPGRWQDSKHLMRDFLTLNSLLEGN